MIILTDKEGQKAVRGLCDMALKVGGISNLEMVNKVLDGQGIVEPPAKEPDKPEE